MGVKERILAIRLMEKANKNPLAAQSLGIMITSGPGPETPETRDRKEG